MEKLNKSLCIYVAYLRALAIVHQNNHWTCHGAGFYQHHLLFERIYNSAQENADEAAEEVVGLFGYETLDLAEQADCINTILKKMKSDEDRIQLSLSLEQEFLEYSKKMYQAIKAESGVMTLGLDDLIMGICRNRESAVYLLKQSLPAKA